MFPNLNSGRLTASLCMNLPASSAVTLMVKQNRHMRDGIAHKRAEGMTLAVRALIGVS